MHADARVVGRQRLALLSGMFDYAGLFPPAALNMSEAVENYSRYKHGPHSDFLGRFVVTASRFAEFIAHAESVFDPNAAGPWRVSVVVDADQQLTNVELLEFNRRHGAGSESGDAVVDSVEVRVAAPADVEAAANVFRAPLHVFCEISPGASAPLLIDAVRGAGVHAKIRMGGITEGAFPRSDEIARVLLALAANAVAFKATAGLHHARRGTYALTYDPRSVCAPMYGYLDLLLAAALARRTASLHDVTAALEGEFADATWLENAVRAGGISVTADDLVATRDFLRSIGTCSFDEPISEAQEFGILA